MTKIFEKPCKCIYGTLTIVERPTDPYEGEELSSYTEHCSMCSWQVSYIEPCGIFD